MERFRTLFWILIATTIALAGLTWIIARAVAATFHEVRA